MKFFVLLCFLSVNLFGQIPDYIKEYHQINSKKEEQNFIKFYKESSDVSIQAYVISLELKQASYKFFPWDKLRIFNKGKDRLENLIKKHPNNIDLRYMRLVIQEKTPSILRYKSSIVADKLFLKEILKIKDTSDYLDNYILKNTSL